MKLHEVRDLVRVRPRRFGRQAALARCHDIDELRTAARRALPRPVFDYVDGGADEETTLAANREAYRSARFQPWALTGQAEPDLSVGLFGRHLSRPIGLAPTGYTRMVHAGGEPAVARAATTRGVPYTVSTVATSTLEQVAEVASSTSLWFQLYVLTDRRRNDSLIDRAAAAGYDVLEVAIDAPVAGHRSRDVRNGLTIPPQLTLRALWDIGIRPGYWASQLQGEPLRIANVATDGASTVAALNKLFDSTVTWSDLEHIRNRWAGTLLLKGPLGPADVKHALDIGVDGVHLSNHGGRQLDRAPSPLGLLRSARDLAGENYPILVDSGIRHGMDIVVALALGANACMVGRPYLYGLAVGGQRGVELAIDTLTSQIRRTLQLLGVANVDELRDQEAVIVHE